MPSATTAESSDSIAPSIAMAKAEGARARMTSRLSPMGSPFADGRCQGRTKEGGWRGMPGSHTPAASKANRVLMVAKRKAGIHRATANAATPATERAMSGAGQRRLTRGQTTSSPSVNAPTTRSGTCRVGKARTRAATRRRYCSGMWTMVRPMKSRSCRVAMTTATPAVKPVVTGKGTNSTSFPMPVAPSAIRIRPAMAVARRRPPRPKRAEMGTRIATKAAVGPETCTRDPPSSPISAPPTIAVYSPCCGGTPEAMASAMERGRATMPTTIPAMASRRSDSPS